MLYNTGARVSEIIGVRVADVVLDGAACVHLHGKGRKQRSVPLWKTTVQEIRAWLRCNPTLRGEAALLPNRDGHAMTRCQRRAAPGPRGGPRGRRSIRSLTKRSDLAAHHPAHDRDAPAAVRRAAST